METIWDRFFDLCCILLRLFDCSS